MSQDDSCAKVETVCGRLPASDLGVTMIHEHVLVDLTCYWRPEDDCTIANSPVTLLSLSAIRANAFASQDNLRLDDIGAATEELRHYGLAGGRTIVDVTPASIGRNVRGLQMIAQATGVNIIAGCGYYIEATHPPLLKSLSVNELVSEFVRDLTEGIQGTEIRAGIIGELGATSYPMPDSERRVLQAAAVAQRGTGVAILTHTAPGTDSAFEVIEILRGAGADTSRVVLSHLDERFRNDLQLFKRLAESGARFGFDTFGRELYYKARLRQHPTDDSRIDTMCLLLENDLRDHIFLSQDICLRHELSALGGPGYHHVVRNIVPRLAARGVTAADIDAILRDNPRRLLTPVIA